jgi:hypothetical protein
LAGMVFLVIGWTAEAIGAAVVWGPRWALSVLVAGGVCGYLALRFEELWREAAFAWGGLRLRAFHFQTARRLAERRRALADEVARALDDAG